MRSAGAEHGVDSTHRPYSAANLMTMLTVGERTRLDVDDFALASDVKSGRRGSLHAQSMPDTPPAVLRTRSRSASPGVTGRPNEAAQLKRYSQEDSARIQQVRSWLQDRQWHEQGTFFTDDYLHVAIHASKNGKQRTFEYVCLKLQQSLKWRREYGSASISRAEVCRALAPGHMYWEGDDKFGRPILFARPADMDLKSYSRDEYVRAHVYLSEKGIRRLPAGVSTFVLVVDASGLGSKHVDLSRDKQLLHIGTQAYPDRMGLLIVGPTNSFISSSWALLRHLMPKRLAEKIVMTQNLAASVADIMPPGSAPPSFLRPTSA